MLMGLLWMGGLIMYGYASQMLGPLGLVLGWPIMMGCTVLTANAWGGVTGEWKGAPRVALWWVTIGVLLLIAGIIVISAATGPQN
jgi:L-rhamnose-H+ transport protein